MQKFKQGLELFGLQIRNTAAGFLGIFSHSNTADRTYTLPDKSGTVAMTSDVSTIVTNTQVAYGTGSGITSSANFIFDGSTTTITGLNVTSTSIQSNQGLQFNPVTNPSSGFTAVVQAVAGNLGIGAYIYLMAFQTATGKTNLYEISAVTTTSGSQQVLLTIPVSSDSRVTGRILYRTTVGGTDTTCKVLTTIADNTTTTYTDNIADASLGTLNGPYSLNTTCRQFTLANSSARSLFVDHFATIGGYFAGGSLTTGGYNTLYGYAAANNMTTGGTNTLIGSQTGYHIVSGNGNTAIGNYSAYTYTTGSYNVSMGASSLINATLASNYNTVLGAYTLTGSGTISGSTVIGYEAGGNSTASYCIYVGYAAGLYETTQANTILIDNLDRTTQALGRSNALIYGVTNATATSQTLALGGGGVTTINGELDLTASKGIVIPSGAPSTTTNNLYQVSQYLYFNGSQIPYFSDFSNSTDTTKGDALISVVQPFTGAIVRTQHSKNSDIINVKDFGAIGDGISRPLSSVTSFGNINTTGYTLAQWQTIFPYASFTGTISGTVLTLITAATGTFLIGQILYVNGTVASAIAIGATASTPVIIGLLISGTLGAIGSTYRLSLAPGDQATTIAMTSYICQALTDELDWCAITAADCAAASKSSSANIKFPCGSYYVNKNISLPGVISWEGEAPGWYYGSGSIAGTTICAAHTGDAISLLVNTGGASQYLDSIGVRGYGTSYSGGCGIVLGSVAGCRLEKCNVFHANIISFIVGDGTSNAYTNKLIDCYSNNPQTGGNFLIQELFFRGDTLISDGGTYGIDFTSGSNNWNIGSVHFEGWTVNGIVCTSCSGGSTFGKNMVFSTANNNTTAILCNGTASCITFNNFTMQWASGSATAGSIGLSVTGSANAIRINNGQISAAQYGIWDASSASPPGTIVDGVTFYQCAQGIYADSNRSKYLNNIFSSTTTYCINHTGGTGGLWQGNSFDLSGNSAIQPTYSGQDGNFNGNCVKDNAGYITHTSGYVPSATSITTVTHGLAVAPLENGSHITLTPYTSGVAGLYVTANPGSTTFTVGWTGTSTIAFNWDARLVCDF